VVFTSRESNQKTRLVRVFCCLRFSPSPYSLHRQECCTPTEIPRYPMTRLKS